MKNWKWWLNMKLMWKVSSIDIEMDCHFFCYFLNVCIIMHNDDWRCIAICILFKLTILKSIQFIFIFIAFRDGICISLDEIECALTTFFQLLQSTPIAITIECDQWMEKWKWRTKHTNCAIIINIKLANTTTTQQHNK